MKFANPEGLKKIMLADAVLVLVIGLNIVFFPNMLARLLGGFSEQTWLIIGVVLVVWSVDLAFTASVPKFLQRFAQLIVYADWAFVVLTLLTLAFLIADFTVPGIAVMMAAAAIAAVFAWTKQKNIGSTRNHLPLAN